MFLSIALDFSFYFFMRQACASLSFFMFCFFHGVYPVLLLVSLCWLLVVVIEVLKKMGAE
jgi:hypothetical protein